MQMNISTVAVDTLL